jgi:hypothetical protein
MSSPAALVAAVAAQAVAVAEEDSAAVAATRF